MLKKQQSNKAKTKLQPKTKDRTGHTPKQQQTTKLKGAAAAVGQQHSTHKTADNTNQKSQTHRNMLSPGFQTHSYNMHGPLAELLTNHCHESL
jgi:hypothetical protein